MKPIIERAEVERVGLDPSLENAFTIEACAEAFEILSSGIYTDSIAAPIRELSCNAYDAHAEAGKSDIPFEIHLPNTIEPWFSVKDFGTGLCEDDLRHMYTTYFKSTKTGSNVGIGEKGLGSKSPIAYADTFTVISRFAGIQQNYEVYLNEDNLPMITKFGNPLPTDEPNGLEVKLTVKQYDFDKFAEKTSKILKYFPVKPIVKGRAHFKFEDLPDDRYEGDGYFTSRGNRYDSDKFTAVMEHVPYRVDVDAISDKLSQYEIEFLAQHKIVVFFENGTLATAASREEIKYKKTSVANLTAAIKKARVDFLKRTDEDLVAALAAGNLSRWDTYLTLSDKFENISRLTAIAGDYTWTAPIVNEWIDSEGKIDFMTPDYHTMVCYIPGRTRALRRKDYTSNSVPHSATIMPTMHHPKVVLMDVSVRSSLRLNQYLQKLGQHDNVITITPTREKTIMERQPNLKSIDYKKDFDDLLAGLGTPEVIKLSEISTDVTVTRSGKRVTGLTFNRFQAEWSPSSAHIRRPDRDIVKAPAAGTTHLYMLVETLSKKMCLRDGTVNDWSHKTAKNKIGQMITIINAVKGTSYRAKELYGLTKKVVKHVKDDPEWVNIYDLFEECANEMVHVYQYFANKNATPTDGGIKYMVFDRRFKDVCEKYLEEDSLIRIHEEDVRMQEELKKLNEDNISTIRILGRECKLDGFKDLPDSVPLFNHRTIIKQYPMLDLIGLNIMSNANTVFTYIADVDAKLRS